MSKNLVKYWTLLLILGAIIGWIYFFSYGIRKQGGVSATIIITLIALDVLHPCTYLWFGNSKLTAEQAKKMTWLQALTSREWWERRVYCAILNQTVTGLLKWLNPLWFIVMPILTLFMPYIGVNQAFLMLNLTTGAQR